MHTIPELGTSVPAFLAKLWKLVEDPETDDLICWSPVCTFILLFIYNHLISVHDTHTKFQCTDRRIFSPRRLLICNDNVA